LTTSSAVRSPVAFRLAWMLSAIVLALMVTAAIGGLLLDGLYVDSENVVEALRGGDLANLVVAAPILTLALWRVRRGSMRAHLVWLGMIGYSLYTYAYYVFGPTFNGLFLVHVAIFTLSGVALGFGFGALDPTGVTNRFRSLVPSRLLGALLIGVALFLVGSYGLATLTHATGGDLPSDVLPFAEWRVHLGYALDLSLLTPAALMAGVLLWRRTAWGYAAATAAFTYLCVYQFNFLSTAIFMDSADIAGAADAIPQAATTIVLFLGPTLVLLWGLNAGSPLPSDDTTTVS